MTSIQIVKPVEKPKEDVDFGDLVINLSESSKDQSTADIEYS